MAINKNRYISRLDGEEITPPSAAQLFGSNSQKKVSLGLLEGQKIIVDSDVAARVETYELLASSKQLQTKPWMNIQDLRAWLMDSSDVAPAPLNFGERHRTSGTGGIDD